MYGIFVIVVMMLTFYHKIFPMISPQSGMEDDTEVETIFHLLSSISMMPRSVGNFVHKVPKMFGPVYAEKWVSEI
jgi:hypothetical protein